jgi:hypothetical protein
MPMISFSVFLDKLINREKCQTIRLPREKNPLQEQDRVNNYWKSRHNIDYKKQFGIPHFLGFSQITHIESLPIRDMDDEIARKDGFDNYEQMNLYFLRQYRENALYKKKLGDIKKMLTTPFDVIEFDWLHPFVPRFQHFRGNELKELTLVHCDVCHTNNLVFKNSHALFCSGCERAYTNCIAMEVS